VAQQIIMSKAKKAYILPVFVALLLVSCSGNEEDEPRFVEGNVIVGFKREIVWRQAYDFAKKYSNDIGYVHGLYYYSNLSNDSLNFVKNFLDAEGFPPEAAYIGFPSNRITIVYGYNIDEDKSTLGDWLTLTEDPILKFEDMQSAKSMLLYITPGTERQWLEAHKNDPLVNYIELDYYFR
jgi:hypothetical protein